jgi:hypothetical protein
MKKTKDKTESGPTFYQTPNGKFLPSVYASALGRYYPYGGTFDMPRQQMYMPLDHVTAKGGYLAPILPMHFDKGTQIYRDTTALPFAEGGPLDENTGVHYKYPGNNSEYLKKGNQWFISNNNTDFNFVPIHDPKGTRAKELNKHATVYKNADKMSTADYEGKLNASLNNAMTRASRAGEFVAGKGEDPQDNFRHPMAGRYTAEAIANKTGNIPYISNALGFLGSNALGVAHEASTIFSDDRPWGVKLTEAGEDIYNNAVGAKVGASNMSAHAKTNYLKYLSNAYKIPDGYGEIHPYRDNWTDPYNQQNQSRVTNSLNTVPLTEKFAHGGKLMDFPAASLSEREANINYNVYASMPGRYYSNGGQFLTAGGEYHRIYKNAKGDIIVNHPAEDKGKWDTINLTDKSGANTVAQGVAATKQWHIDNPNSYGNGGMIKRANGSYSQRGLWDNIRANKGSGKKPTKEMLAQEKKIKSNQYGLGGHKAVFFPTNVSEPGAADKDLTYPKNAYVYANGGNLYDEGGPVYTYAGRPNARYRKEGNSWAISVDGGNSFTAIKDPTGKRTTLLNKQAKPIITTNYDPLAFNQISDNTRTVIPNQAVSAMNTHVYMESPEYKARQKAEKEAQIKFEQEQWNKYKNASTLEKVGDRVSAFAADPLGMTARVITGEQAYFPGMGTGLVDNNNPDRERYLKAVGYTPGAFEVSDLQNMVNPGYWANSIGTKFATGHPIEGAAEIGLMSLGLEMPGTQTAKKIASGLNAAPEFLTTQTPLQNFYKINSLDKNINTFVPKKYSFETVAIPKGAEGKMHNDAVDIINREFNNALTEANEMGIAKGSYAHPERSSVLALDDVGYDYKLPEGVDHTKLNQIAVRASSNKLSSEDADIIAKLLIAHNPNLKTIAKNVDNEFILHGVASNLDPKDIEEGYKVFKKGKEMNYDEEAYNIINTLQNTLPENRGLGDFVYSPETLEKIKKLKINQ